MSLNTIPPDDRAALVAALRSWRDAGEKDPHLPLYDDFDGDGVCDFVGLDEQGELVLVSGATVDSSVSVSTGEDAA